MNCCKVLYKKKAKKWFLSNPKMGLRFLKAFDEISQDIRGSFFKHDIKKMKVLEIFRLRIGKIRALFEIKNNEVIILVINIDSCSEIYK